MKRQRVTLAIGMPLLTAGMLVGAYAFAQQGLWGCVAATAAVGLVGFWDAVVVLGFVPRRRSLGLSGRGVGLSNSPALAGLMLASLVSFVLLLVGIVGLWGTTGKQPTAAAGPIVMLGIAMVAAAPVVVRLLRGGYRLGGLELTPEKITYTSFVREHSISWDSLVGIEMHPTLGRLELYATQLPTVRGPRVLAGEKPSDARTVPDPHVLVIPPGLLRTDGEQLRDLLEYYRAHPRDRHELGDGSALERTFERVSS